MTYLYHKICYEQIKTWFAFCCCFFVLLSSSNPFENESDRLCTNESINWYWIQNSQRNVKFVWEHIQTPARHSHLWRYVFHVDSLYAYWFIARFNRECTLAHVESPSIYMWSMIWMKCCWCGSLVNADAFQQQATAVCDTFNCDSTY